MAAKNKLGFLSSNLLKIIAMAAMVIDHASVIFIGPETNVWRYIGRIAFPIFAFMIAEGAVHTKNKFLYAARLLAFAVISEVPFDMAFNGTYLEFSKQNVFFTLFLGLIAVYCLDFFRKKGLGALGIVTTIICALSAFFLSSDYGFTGVIVITLMYMFSTVKTGVRYLGFAIAGLMTSIVYVFPLSFGFIPSQVYAALCFIPLAFYNGKRGRKMNRYFFYAFYPVHIIILYFIKMFIA